MKPPAPQSIWHKALSVRGLVAKKVRERLDVAAADDRIEFRCPSDQPYRRMFGKIVNMQAARKWSAGNYRMQSFNDPPRIVVWRAPSMSGVPVGTGMSRGRQEWLSSYKENSHV